ncbi:MAG: peptide chain release factor N(5)-glutamine methyltransferase [bacterium]|nr:peptide chain release factor N(5)-glutamine methyltransferase [bacterium]
MAQEQSACDEGPALAAVRQDAARAAGGDRRGASRHGRYRRSRGEDPHLQFPAGPGDRSPHRFFGAQPTRRDDRRDLPAARGAGHARTGRAAQARGRGLTTIGQLVDAATARLRAGRVDEARDHAELLLAHLLDTDRGGVFVRRADPAPAGLSARFEAMVERRLTREPFQHIVGTQEFHGLTLRCDSRALVPRPETEGLVDAVLGLELPPGAVVADLGTGSGCIVVALAVRQPGLRLLGLDRSADALALARENVALHGVEDRVELAAGDFAAPPEAWLGRCSAVVSNPPYVTEAEWSGLAPEVRVHDPKAALVPGPSGLEAYRALAPAARGLLVPGGTLALELGAGQADDVRVIVERNGFERIEIRPDLRGIPRVLSARIPAVGNDDEDER